jgi:quercetin dioxygenase-like cupin family protein
MNPLLTRQFVSGAQGMVARLMLKKGCVVPTHSHHNEQIAYVISGSLEFLIGDPATPVSHIIRSGELLVIPGNVLHSAIALEDTEDIDFFAPPREDWLTGSDAYLR